MRDTAHKSGLAAAFVAGAAVLVLIALKPKDADPVWMTGPVWMAAAPVAVIVLYALVMRLLRRGAGRGIDVEAVGDNCYYLGFVFTLVSLAVTLYRLFPAEAAQTAPDAEALVPVREVISGFGVALSSTIAGIVLRVLHIRMGVDTGSLSHEARDDLAAAVSRFRDNLGESNRLMRDFAAATAQLLSELRADMLKAVREANIEYGEALTERVKTHIDAIADAVEPAAGKAAAALSSGVAEVAAAAHKELAAHMAELGRKESEAIRSTAASVVRIAADLAGLQNSIAELTARLNAIGHDVSGRLDPAASAFETGVNRATGALGRSEAAFSALSASLDSARAGLSEQLAPSARNFAQGLEGTAGALANADAAFAGLAGRLATAGDGLAERVDPAARAFGSGVAKAIEALDRSDAAFALLASRLGAAGAELSSLDPAVGAFRQGATDATKALAEASAALNGAAEKLALTARDFERQMSSGPHRRLLVWLLGWRRR